MSDDRRRTGNTSLYKTGNFEFALRIKSLRRQTHNSSDQVYIVIVSASMKIDQLCNSHTQKFESFILPWFTNPHTEKCNTLYSACILNKGEIIISIGVCSRSHLLTGSAKLKTFLSVSFLIVIDFLHN